MVKSSKLMQVLFLAPRIVAFVVRPGRTRRLLCPSIGARCAMCPSFPFSASPRHDTSRKSKNNNDFDDEDRQEQREDDSVIQREQMLQSLGLDPRNNDALLDYSIDSFLRGEFDRPFSDDAAAPLPGLSPRDTVDQALRSLRDLDVPEPSHGAACFLRFCVPLSRGERWGGSTSSSSWKELLRGALTPTMLARRIRASEEFSCLLDWEKLDVTEGAPTGKTDVMDGLETIAFVNAALNFGEQDGSEPEMMTFKLIRIGGVWMIDSAQRSRTTLFQEASSSSSRKKRSRESSKKSQED